MFLFKENKKNRIDKLFEIKERKKDDLSKKIRKAAVVEKKVSSGGYDLNWHVSASLILAGLASLIFLSIYIGMFLKPIFLVIIWVWIFCAVIIFVYWNEQFCQNGYSKKKLAKVISFYIAVTMITQLLFCPISLKIVSYLHNANMNLLKIIGIGLFFIINWLVNLFIFNSFISAYYAKVKFAETFVLHAVIILISIIIFGFLY